MTAAAALRRRGGEPAGDGQQRSARAAAAAASHAPCSHPHRRTDLAAGLQIRTTKVKAKVIRSYVDKMITLAKDGSLHARRQVGPSRHSLLARPQCGTTDEAWMPAPGAGSRVWRGSSSSGGSGSSSAALTPQGSC
jgi:hypothetical protein